MNNNRTLTEFVTYLLKDQLGMVIGFAALWAGSTVIFLILAFFTKDPLALYVGFPVVFGLLTLCVMSIMIQESKSREHRINTEHAQRLAEAVRDEVKRAREKEVAFLFEHGANLFNTEFRWHLRMLINQPRSRKLYDDFWLWFGLFVDLVHEYRRLGQDNYAEFTLNQLIKMFDEEESARETTMDGEWGKIRARLLAKLS